MNADAHKSSSDIASFIRLARSRMGQTQEQFAERFNCTKGNVSAWENGRHEPSFLTLRQISEASKVDLPATSADQYAAYIDGVMSGENSFAFINAERSVTEGGEVFNSSHSRAGLKADRSASPSTFALKQAALARVDERHDDIVSPTEDEFSFVQQLDLRASCGNGRFDEHVVVKGGLAFKRSSLREFGVPENHARIIYADGTSMEPTIGHGRVVLINLADTTPVDGKVYLICDPDGATYLKRLVREYHPQMGGMAWLMRSDNPNKKDFPDKLLPDDARTTIVGRAVWNDNTL